MNKNFKLFVFLSIFCLSVLKLPAAEEVSFPNPDLTISMDFQDASLKDVLKIFSIQAGLNFIASEAVQDRKITLFLDKVPIQQVMDKLFKANNLSYELDPDSNIFIVKDWGTPAIETVTRVFYLKYATVSSSSIKEHMATDIGTATTSTTTTGTTSTGGTTTSTSAGKWKVEDNVGITQAVKKLLSSSGSVIEDYRTNSLIVTDTPSRMSVIAQTIALLDVPIVQVLIEVEMLDVSKNLVDKMGFEHGNNPFTWILPGMQRAKFFMGDVTYRGAEDIKSSTAGSIVFGRTFAEVLDFLRTQTDTKYLARPRLLTLNNETAEIKITTQESVGVKTTTEATTGTTSAEPERTETGVSLRVTPQVNIDTGEITMFIHPEVSEATAGSTITSGDKSYQFRDPEIRSTKSIVKVKDGETVIVGGLIRNEFTQVVKKIPILGDIPVVGALFRHKNKSKDKERELLVFITPRLIKDTGTKFVSPRKVKLPTREQSASSVLDRQMSINTTLNTFEKTR